MHLTSQALIITWNRAACRVALCRVVTEYECDPIVWRHELHGIVLCIIQRHLQDGYGRLIGFYTKLINQKLKFHEKVRHISLRVSCNSRQSSMKRNNVLLKFFAVRRVSWSLASRWRVVREVCRNRHQHLVSVWHHKLDRVAVVVLISPNTSTRIKWQSCNLLLLMLLLQFWADGRLSRLHGRYSRIATSRFVSCSSLQFICAQSTELCEKKICTHKTISFLVFSSLEMTRANSMTPAGQCRLAPLIPCIQDSCQLYDYIVKMLFKLHASKNSKL